MKSFLTKFPPFDILKKEMQKLTGPEYREVNAHIHTPYSFSAFPDMETIFRMAIDENITVLGINDFFVTGGYDAFHDGSLKSKIFPLFNIEFIGLLKEEQKKGIRINDPNNPGRIYFCGKGLDYPFSLGLAQKLKLNTVIRESQYQMKAMITKLNKLIEPVNPSLALSYEKIKKQFAHNLVRERHLAKAVRFTAEKNYPDPAERLKFIESVYGGRKSESGVGNATMLENEIRSNLLKSGGSAFVQENEDSFLELGSIMKIILKAGGIPCYPVLLDDPSGNYTEFENDKNKLHETLSANKIGCIELIPGRNSLSSLREFVRFFHERNYLITFGTEHNTPDLSPLTVYARGSEPIDNELKRISWESVCVIAAHQYLRAQGMQGYVLSNGSPSIKQKQELTALGKLVIEFYLSKN